MTEAERLAEALEAMAKHHHRLSLSALALSEAAAELRRQAHEITVLRQYINTPAYKVSDV